MSARFIVGDSLAVTRTLRDQCIDFLMCSPPFLALRFYLPADHPDKALEIGSEATPAAFIDVLLELSAEWRRVLAPHGSICVELGDTYAGSGGAGGDYLDGGIRYGAPAFDGSMKTARTRGDGMQHPISRVSGATSPIATTGPAWPRAKSLTLIPEAYRMALVYGVNPHTGQASPAGRWQVRNVIRWVRPNPPVGALGKKWRPATSELVVACPDDDRRYWDDVATRTEYAPITLKNAPTVTGSTQGTKDGRTGTWKLTHAGAPLLDWWKITPTGYPGAHYAVYPAELCEAPIEAMCPRRVCTTCGEPSRRETSEPEYVNAHSGTKVDKASWVDGGELLTQGAIGRDNGSLRSVTTDGWTSCGCPGTDGIRLDGYHTGSGWRPGVVFDPFAGTGTTLAVATGHGRDAIGIDLDERNADLALERVGPLLLTVEHHGEPVEHQPVGPHNSTGNPRFRVGYDRRDGRKTMQQTTYGEPANPTNHLTGRHQP